MVNRCCELVHSLDSDSAARRLEIPALVQVNLADEPSKSGVGRRSFGAYVREGGDRAVDDASRRADGGGVAALVQEAPRARRRARTSELSMGTTQDFAVAAEEGATYVRVGSILFRN